MIPLLFQCLVETFNIVKIQIKQMVRKRKHCSVERKRCDEPECDKSAVGKSSKCVGHGGGKRCDEPECDKSAQGKGSKCISHGGGKRCDEPECDKSAIGKSSKCISHGGGKRCDEPECDKSAQGKTSKCASHGGGKRCDEPECPRGAVGKTNKCASHGGGKRCDEPECDKSARGKSSKCISHGGGKRCAEPECDKSALGKGNKCASHGGGKRCAEPECDRSAVGKTNKCAGHGGGNRCVICTLFSVNKIGSKCSMCDPTSKTASRLLSKERVILKLLVASFPEFLITYNTSVGTSCGRYRPDFVIDAVTHFVIVEVDEFSHNSYDKSCESIRQENIVQALGLPSIFIRYNPDAHHDPLTKKSIFVSSINRQKKLIQRVTYHLATRPVWLIDKTHDTEYMYYDQEQEF